MGAGMREAPTCRGAQVTVQATWPGEGTHAAESGKAGDCDVWGRPQVPHWRTGRNHAALHPICQCNAGSTGVLRGCRVGLTALGGQVGPRLRTCFGGAPPSLCAWVTSRSIGASRGLLCPPLHPHQATHTGRAKC